MESKTTEEYIHDYRLIPDSETPRELRMLHQDHRFALNEARGYISEFRDMDYDGENAFYRVKFMLRDWPVNYLMPHLGKTTTLNRCGKRLTSLPCQDDQVLRVTEGMRQLYYLLKSAHQFMTLSGDQRREARNKFLEKLEIFKSKYHWA